MKHTLISVIIPAFNEAKTITKNIIEINKILNEIGMPHEILVVDDGSLNGTLPLLEENFFGDSVVRILFNEHNVGKGWCILHGLFNVVRESSMVVWIDGDLDISPDYIRRFFNIFTNLDVDGIIGSKMHHLSNIDYPPLRKFLSFGYYMFIKILFGLPYKDTQTGIKMFTKQCLDVIKEKLLVKKFAFDLEVLVALRRNGYRIMEMPVEVSNKRNRVRFNTVWRMFIDTLAIWYRDRIRNHYDINNNGL